MNADEHFLGAEYFLGGEYFFGVEYTVSQMPDSNLPASQSTEQQSSPGAYCAPQMPVSNPPDSQSTLQQISSGSYTVSQMPVSNLPDSQNTRQQSMWSKVCGQFHGAYYARQRPVSNLPASQSTRQQSSPGAVSVVRPAVPAPSFPPERIRLMQQELLLLLHAEECLRRENQSNGEVVCRVLECRTVKEKLRHSTNCYAGNTCPVPRCSLFRRIFLHWRNCTRSDCPVCEPMRRFRQQSSSRAQSVPQMPVSNLPGSQSTAQQSSPGTVSVARPAVPAPLPTDPERIRVMQERLVILLHTYECLRRENQSNGEVDRYRAIDFRTVKEELRHLSNCYAGNACLVPYCSSSRQILLHWRNCTRSVCPLCFRVRRIRQAMTHQTSRETSSR